MTSDNENQRNSIFREDEQMGKFCFHGKLNAIYEKPQFDAAATIPEINTSRNSVQAYQSLQEGASAVPIFEPREQGQIGSIIAARQYILNLD